MHSRQKITIYTDHYTLQDILKLPKLSSTQCRHLRSLQQHDYEVYYFACVANVVVDTLSRRAHSRVGPLNQDVIAIEWSVSSVVSWLDEVREKLQADIYFESILWILKGESAQGTGGDSRMEKTSRKAGQRVQIFIL